MPAGAGTSGVIVLECSGLPGIMRMLLRAAALSWPGEEPGELLEGAIGAFFAGAEPVEKQPAQDGDHQGRRGGINGLGRRAAERGAATAPAALSPWTGATAPVKPESGGRRLVDMQPGGCL